MSRQLAKHFSPLTLLTLTQAGLYRRRPTTARRSLPRPELLSTSLADRYTPIPQGGSSRYKDEADPRARMSHVLSSERLRRVPGRLVIQSLMLTMQRPTQQHIGNLEYNRLSSQLHCISLYLYGSV